MVADTIAGAAGNNNSVFLLNLTAVDQA